MYIYQHENEVEGKDDEGRFKFKSMHIRHIQLLQLWFLKTNRTNIKNASPKNYLEKSYS